MRRVIIESPFAGDLERNKRYLEWCIADSIRRGEAPFASHRMYPGALNDDIPEDRQRGIEAGYAWWGAAKLVAFYMDYGLSEGMKQAMLRAIDRHKPYEERLLWPEL